MKPDTYIVTVTGDWFDPATQRVGIRKPTDLFVGFGERRFIPLASTSFYGVQYDYGVVSCSGQIRSSSNSAREYRQLLHAQTREASRGYSHYIVPTHVRTTDLESDRAVLQCIAEIEKTTALHWDVTPTYRGVADFYPCTEPGFDMYGLTIDHYHMSRLVTLCRTLADIGTVATFLPRYPDTTLTQRESEQKFLDEIIAPLLESVPDLRVVLHQVRTTYGVEWVIKHAFDGTVDGEPRVIASVSPFDMEEPFDTKRTDLTDYQRQVCHDAAAVRYYALSYPQLFCLGSGSSVGAVGNSASHAARAFRAPVIMQTLLEYAFDIHRLPKPPTLMSSISPQDREIVRQGCASRIDALSRFVAETGPDFLGLLAPAREERLVFEPGECIVAPRWRIKESDGDGAHNVVISWRAEQTLAWKCVLDPVES